MFFLVRTLAIASLFVFASPAFSDSFRCGTKLVKVGDSSASVSMKCGEPRIKESNQTTCSVGIKAATTVGNGVTTYETNAKTCRAVEVWTYNAGQGEFARAFVFEGGTLVAIKLGDRAD